MNATVTPPAPGTTILPAEAAHFGGLAAEWWDPHGSSKMLHRLNPVRLRFVRAAIDTQWGGDRRALKPLAGRRVLDVGCGAGLLAEPLARLGGAVTGIDAAPENIAVARAHAAGQGLAIEYRAGGIEDVGEDRFDLVTTMEVIEHVADPAGFVCHLARMLAPGGLLILSTPNRTALSRLALIGVGEGLGLIPRGTHEWDRFLAPDTITAMLQAEGLVVRQMSGIALSPTIGFVLGDDLRLNYILSATHEQAKAA